MKTYILITTSLLLIAALGCATHEPVAHVAINETESQIYIKDVAAQSPRLETSKPVCPKEDRVWQGQTWKKLMSYANGCVMTRDWNQAEKIANLMATTDPLSPWGSFYLSLAAEGKGDFPRALWMISLAHKKTTKSALVLYQEGRILFEMNETAQAADLFRNALRVDPDFLEANLALGHILYRERYMSEALGYFERALAKDTENYAALVAAAECKIEKNDFQTASSYLLRAERLEPQHASIRLKLAEIQEDKLKDYTGALSTYREIKNLAKRRRLDQGVSVDLDGKIKKLEGLVAQADKVDATTARGPTSQKEVTK